MPTPKQQALSDISLHKNHEWEKLENILLTIVGGALVASTSATLFGNKEGFSHLHVLLTSWLLLSLSLISLLLSYAFCEILNKKTLSNINSLPDNTLTIQVERVQSKWAFYAVDYSNYTALGSGIL